MFQCAIKWDAFWIFIGYDSCDGITGPTFLVDPADSTCKSYLWCVNGVDISTQGCSDNTTFDPDNEPCSSNSKCLMQPTIVVIQGM